MSEMTLPSRQRIRNSNPVGLRPSTLPLGHGSFPQYEWMEKKHFYFFQTAKTGKRAPNSSVKGSGANHCPRATAQGSVHPVKFQSRGRGGGLWWSAGILWDECVRGTSCPDTS